MFNFPNPGSSGLGQGKSKGAKAAPGPVPLALSGPRYGEGAATASGGLALRDPVTQYVQIQLLQVRPPTSLCVDPL